MYILSRGENLEDVLAAATSQDLTRLKAAEELLKSQIEAPNFFLQLAIIFMDKNKDEMIRWSSVLFFKNFIETRLQARSSFYLSEEELLSLMQTLLQDFTFPYSPLSEQIALVTSRVARREFKKWSSLIPTLIHHFDYPQAQNHAMLTLHKVLKALSSRRLSSDRRDFVQLSNELLPLLCRHWLSACQQLSNDTKILSSLLKCHFTLKIVRLLLRHTNLKNDDVSKLSTNIIHSITPFTQLDTSHNTDMTLLRNKILNTTSKFTLEWVQKEGVDNLDDVVDVIFHHSLPAQYPKKGEEKLVVNLLNCIKILVAKNIKDKDGGPLVKVEHIEKLLPPLFSHLLPLSPAEIEAWDEDEDEFLIQEYEESDHVCLRGCVESLLRVLCEEFESQCCNYINVLLQQLTPISQHSTLQQVLFKDMVYNAIGICLNSIKHHINFISLLHHQLLNDLSSSQSHYRVVRRRALWLLGKCLYEEATSVDQSVFMLLLTPLLNTQLDVATLFEAVRTLRYTLDNSSFDETSYQPYVEQHVRSVVYLMQSSSSPLLKKEVLQLLDSIIAHMDPIQDYVQLLAHTLPLVCAHTHLVGNVVATTTDVVQKVGVGCMHDWLVELLKEVTKYQSEVWEDGVLLWLAVIRNSAYLSPALLSLFINMPPLLEHAREVLETLMCIIRAYIFIDASVFLQRWSVELSECLRSVWREVTDEGKAMIMKLLSLMEATCGIHAEMHSLLIHNISFLAQPELDITRGDLISAHVVLWSRIVLNHQKQPSLLPALIQSYASSSNISTSVLEAQLMHGWLDTLEHVSLHKHLKTSALALLSLLPTSLLMVEERTNKVLNACVSAMHRVCDTSVHPCVDNLTLKEVMVFEDGDDDELFHSSVWRETLRKNAEKDSVLTSDLVVLVSRAYESFGINNVEYEVESQLKHLLKPK